MKMNLLKKTFTLLAYNSETLGTILFETIFVWKESIFCQRNITSVPPIVPIIPPPVTPIGYTRVKLSELQATLC